MKRPLVGAGKGGAPRTDDDPKAYRENFNNIDWSNGANDRSKENNETTKDGVHR